MKILRQILCMALSITILFAFSACANLNAVFKETKDGVINTVSETEYEFLAMEGTLFYFGELKFRGSVKGEDKILHHLSSLHRTGLYSIKNDDDHNILIRIYPDSEWFGIYRKASLPEFDFSIDNCVRLELIGGSFNDDIIHTTCGEGITDKAEIAEFLSDVRSQVADEDELFDLITKPNGMLENCYSNCAIYGFFEEEPNLAIRMQITSYNDLVYSISIGQEEYVLPEEWLERLQNCSH